MATRRIIGTGITIIIASSFFLNLLSIFHDYAYDRLNVNRNILLTCIWLTNVYPSYSIYLNKINGRVFISIFYIFLLSGVMTFFHFIYLSDLLSGFSINEIRAIYGIYFTISTLINFIGALGGFLASLLKRSQ